MRYYFIDNKPAYALKEDISTYEEIEDKAQAVEVTEERWMQAMEEQSSLRRNHRSRV